MAGTRGKRNREPAPLNDEMISAALLSATGKSYSEISKEIGVTAGCVSKWFSRPDVLALKDAELRKMMLTMKGKAYAVLSAQLEESNNPWIRQNAAKEVIRLCEKMDEIDDQSIEVTFGSMPEPGVPKSGDEEEASEIEVIGMDDVPDD